MILESNRLLLRRLDDSDRTAIFALHTDPLVVRLTTEDGLPMTRAQSDERVDLYLDEWERFGFGFFVVYEKQANGDLLFAGRCGLRHFLKDEIELGYCFSERASGRGLATEAARLVIADAFSRLECNKLVALVRPANLQSQNVLLKLGFSSTGIINHRGCCYYHFERLR